MRLAVAVSLCQTCRSGKGPARDITRPLSSLQARDVAIVVALRAAASNLICPPTSGRLAMRVLFSCLYSARSLQTGRRKTQPLLRTTLRHHQGPMSSRLCGGSKRCSTAALQQRDEQAVRAACVCPYLR